MEGILVFAVLFPVGVKDLDSENRPARGGDMTGSFAIVIVDDHDAFRKGLRQIIEDQQLYEIVGEASDGSHALELIRRMKPAVAILDISIPPPDGLAVARTLREEKVPVEIILLTMYREEGILESAHHLGLSYVLKDSAMIDIVAALEAACRGERYTSPLLTSNIQESTRTAAAPLSRQEYHRALSDLSPMERRVLDLIAEYHTNKDIAETLDIEATAVEDYRTHICRKLNLTGNHALMKFALNLKSTPAPNRSVKS